MKKREMIYALVVVFILVVAFVFYYLSFRVKRCSDGTPYDQCSEVKPYLCLNGVLTEKASLCSCSELSIRDDEKCFSPYQSNPKDVTLNYILRGKTGKINFVVYKNLSDYLSKIPRYVNSNENPTLLDFKVKMIDEPYQRELLLPLVLQIENITENKEDQARIAVSIVQNIPFGSSDKKIRIGGTVAEYQRYPYEVLYEMEGICSEKAELLVFLLREMGYQTAFLYYPYENHEAVGIKCPERKSNIGGYCFIETTAPSIITDDKTEYFGAERNINSAPTIMAVSEGLTFGNNLYEYRDARSLIAIREKANSNVLNLFYQMRFKSLTEKYGLAVYYNSYTF